MLRSPVSERLYARITSSGWFIAHASCALRARSCGSCFEVERSHDIALPCHRVHLWTEPPRWHGMAWHGMAWHRIVSHILLGDHTHVSSSFSLLVRSLSFNRLLPSSLFPRTVASHRFAPLTSDKIACQQALRDCATVNNTCPVGARASCVHSWPRSFSATSCVVCIDWIADIIPTDPTNWPARQQLHHLSN